MFNDTPNPIQYDALMTLPLWNKSLTCLYPNATYYLNPEHSVCSTQDKIDSMVRESEQHNSVAYVLGKGLRTLFDYALARVQQSWPDFIEDNKKILSEEPGVFSLLLGMQIYQCCKERNEERKSEQARMKAANELAAKQAPFEIALLCQVQGNHAHAMGEGVTRLMPAPNSSIMYPSKQDELAYAMGIMAHLPAYIQEEVMSHLPAMKQCLAPTKQTRGVFYLAKAKELEDKRNVVGQEVQGGFCKRLRM